jgi:hypothetical protein
MKKQLMMILLLLTASAFAQDDSNIEKVSFRTMIIPSNINCVTPIGRDSVTRTVLNLKLSVPSEIVLLMDHKEASLLGCDVDALDRLLELSLQRFGYIHTTVTVTKTTDKLAKIIFGKCQRNYSEQLELVLEEGTILKTSKIGKRIPATDCLQ